ncbi:hypothetical protein BS47DRAFT_1367288 [Hydnum rufescens UP504]|uniref:Heme peroxidase n=1 Tax=Hydnum rufescens UP504 TaxID=1448309 RepID=A0A9P6AJN9_9AGAM|nr:hypothetical protein BS47DRAFT_1367288 [Hydnum rufescens UP504]
MSGIPTLQAALKAVDTSLANVGVAAEAIHTSFSPLPPVPSDYNNEAPPASFVAKGIDAVRAQVQRGLPSPALAPKEIRAAIDGVATKLQLTEGLDDRDDGLELVLSALSRSPKGPIATDVEVQAISLLYRDLPHPPSTHVGQRFQFRSADGSGNSLSDPNLGKSFTPYSRSVSTTRPLPINELPDPGVAFDTLLRRDPNDAIRPRPRWSERLVLQLGGKSCSGFPTHVIHNVFRTSRTDWNINETSSYVDLAVLYGNTQGHQDKIRYKDGRGRLLPDVFAETRLLTLPPGVAALTVCFNRHHNYIADILLSINERGSWNADLKALAEDELVKQDEEIFQTARLINSAFYANAVIGDYLPAILGTQRDASSWSLDSTAEHRLSDHTLLERGQGNSVSVEFNTLYRWHPSLSLDDTAYAEGAFKGIFPNLDFDQTSSSAHSVLLRSRNCASKDGKPIPPPDMDSLTAKEFNALRDDSQPVDYLQFSIRTLQRDPRTKLYPDDGLARILQKATSVPAGPWGPAVLRVIEILGIRQAHRIQTSKNGIPTAILPKQLANFIGNIENLELYVGLAAEENRTVKPGVGFCSPYTTARAVLADAVALVRGDRYLTYDLTPFNLTTWGFAYANRNPNNAAWGGQLGRVLARALPNHYDADSVYTHFPLITPTGQPDSMDNIVQKNGYGGQYSIAPPVILPPTTLVTDPVAIYDALRDDTDKKLVTPYVKNILDIKLSPSFLTSIDDARAYGPLTKSIQELFVPKSDLDAIGQYFYDKTLQLLGEKSLRLNDKIPHFVDIVRDVLRLVPVHWASTQIAGLPLKTSTEPHGIYYEQQMYQILKDIYSFIFLEPDTSLKIPQRREAKQYVERLLPFIKISLSKAKGGVSIPGALIGPISNLILGQSDSSLNALLKRLLALHSSIDDLANDILAVISSSSTELSQIFVHVVNFYLPPDEPSKYAQAAVKDDHKRKKDLFDQIVQVAGLNTHDSTLRLEGYIREALRLDPAIEGVYRQTRTTEKTTSGAIKGERYWYDFRAAGLNASRFNTPGDVDPTRPTQLYSTLHGDGVFKTLGEDFVYKVAGQVLRAVFTRSNLKRATGSPGTLRRFPIPILPTRDTVQETKKQVEVPIPYKTGETAFTDEYTYVLTPPQGDRSFRYQYQDPEDEYRPTTWATGLSLTVSIFTPPVLRLSY